MPGDRAVSRDNWNGGPGGRPARPAADISSAIELYQPKRVGADSPAALEASLPSAREWVAAAEPRSAKQARRMMLVTAEYVLWAYQRGIPMKASVALNRQNVNHWIFKVKKSSDGRWQGNAKWVLQKVGKAVGAGGWPQEQIAVKRTDPAAPYDAAQEQSFRQQAAQRHRQSRSERLFVAVGACGCGMSGREISLACRGDFADLGGERIGLRVGGRNPRLVPIRADYTPLARMAAESAPDDHTDVHRRRCQQPGPQGRQRLHRPRQRWAVAATRQVHLAARPPENRDAARRPPQDSRAGLGRHAQLPARPVRRRPRRPGRRPAGAEAMSRPKRRAKPKRAFSPEEIKAAGRANPEKSKQPKAARRRRDRLPDDYPGIRAVRIRISTSNIKRALRSFKKSGVLPYFQERLGEHPGYASQLPPKALLTAMLIAAELNSSYRRTEITAVLSSLSAKAAGMLGLFSAGIKNAAPSYNVVVDQCQRVEAALEMGWTASDGTRCDMQWFITSLIEASVPREVAKAVAAIAIDATAAATWAATRQYAVESEARAARDAHDHEVDGEYQGVEIADNGRVRRGADFDALAIYKSATNRQPARILVGYYHNLGAITRKLTYRGNPDCIEIGDKQPGFIVSYNVSTDQDPSHGIDLYDDAADLAGNNLQVQADQGYTRYNRDFLAPLRKRGAEPFIGLPVTAKRYPNKVYLGKKEREFWQYCGALYPPWISEERLLPPRQRQRRRVASPLRRTVQSRLVATQQPHRRQNPDQVPPMLRTHHKRSQDSQGKRQAQDLRRIRRTRDSNRRGRGTPPLLRKQNHHDQRRRGWQTPARSLRHQSEQDRPQLPQPRRRRFQRDRKLRRLHPRMVPHLQTPRPTNWRAHARPSPQHARPAARTLQTGQSRKPPQKFRRNPRLRNRSRPRNRRVD